MTTVNDINKIYCDEQINVKQINMTSLLFIDNKAVSKSRYSVVDNFINILDVAEDTLCLYQHRGSSNYYEYEVNLKTAGTIISGTDVNGNTMKLLSKNNMMVFVNGYKLLPSQFNINTSNNSITILNAFIENDKYTVIVYVSSSLIYYGDIESAPDWNYDEHSFTLSDYTYLRYLFFKNGEIITRDYITKVDETVTINVSIREGIDVVEYYCLPIDTENVLFYADPGYFSYGPKDVSGLPVPEIHDAEVTFESIVRLAIDDVRKGFFIRENNGNGCLMITGNDFETNIAYCTTVVSFSNTIYNKEEYFVQVPNARSILNYISEYDLKKMLMPEILESFQNVLLDETYDSIQRLKNIRSINNVDSSQIGQLINFMGLNINTSSFSLQKKHALLEELTNFYKIVGTRESYNFYNTMTSNAKIIGMDQLFTPIKDINSGTDPVKRYVDFRTAEELGAETKKRHDYEFNDLGYVDELAQLTDSFTNQPRSEGERSNTSIPPITYNKRLVTYTNSSGNLVNEWINVPLNNYTILPTPGPNTSQIDFGKVTESATSFYDFGSVTEIIKGKWVEWTEWDRPKNWYPTNHVNISVQIPPDSDYENFMTEFKNTFYNIASAVLYIHSIVEVYTFGKDSGGGANFDIPNTPTYHSLEYTFTNDPARQDYRG